MIKNKKYFITQIDSSTAYQFTCMYHYSHRGFKKSKLNLGIFRNDTEELVGVLQWGCSAQEKINLKRYVKEDLTNKQYLELNRFCMSNDEERNSESQAISLGIKWIKKNRPDIQLLVSYAGRKEGNYGYIYQATNWEYLGYFISSGFWLLDGEEYHQISLWYKHTHHGNPQLPFLENICSMYKDVRRTWSKQFIYIIRLNKKLTPVNKQDSYPKIDNEYPIQTKVEIYQQNNDHFKLQETNIDIKHYYFKDIKDNKLFTDRTLLRQGVTKKILHSYLVYSIDGSLYGIYNSKKDIKVNDCKIAGINKSIKTGKIYKSYYFKEILRGEDYPLSLNVPCICWIDDIAFYTRKDIERYCGVSRQAVHQAFNKRANKINGFKVTWNEENNENEVKN